MSIAIYYDGECPFCAKYVTILRLRDAVGPVALVDLRTDHAARARFEENGFDPDKGMIVETADRILHGADAMNALSLMSTSSGTLNALAAMMFRNRLLAVVLYPVLRAGRNMALFLLGRNPIGIRDQGEAALFDIFARFLGLLAILHAFGYVLLYSSLDVNLTTPLLIITGLGLFLAPGSRRLFVAVVLVFAVDAWLQAPITSNHAMLKNFLILTILFAGIWHMLKGSGWDRFFQDFRPVGQMLLLVMYTFGIFQKNKYRFFEP